MDHVKSKPSTPWKPTNALAYIGIFALRLFSKLPFGWQVSIGKFVGLAAWYLIPYRKSVGLTNIRLCFPQWTEAKRKNLLKAHYAAMGIGFAELATAWYRPDSFFENISEFKGIEILDRLKKEKRGALLITGHFTTLEIIGRILAINVNCSALYRSPNQPVIAAEMTKRRIKLMRTVISTKNIRLFIKTLREGHFIWYGPDQGKRIKQSVIAPFFGEPAVTNSATAKIAKKTNAAIIPFVGYRKKDNTYSIQLLDERTQICEAETEEESARLTNQIIEEAILHAPEQYFWLHKRFKNRGDPHPSVY